MPTRHDTVTLYSCGYGCGALISTPDRDGRRVALMRYAVPVVRTTTYTSVHTDYAVTVSERCYAVAEVYPPEWRWT